MRAGSRRPTSGPERDLVKRYLTTVQQADRTLDGVILEEVCLPTGYPDIIIVEFGSRSLRTLTGRGRSGTVQAYKLLQFLYSYGSCEIRLAADILKAPLARLERVARGLASAGFLQDHQLPGMLQVKDEILGVARIVAIEAKVRDWRGAIRQAIANTWFASHSFILMPSSAVTDECLVTARNFGVGVIGENASYFVELVPPLEVALPASYGTWLVGEVAARIQEATRGGRRLAKELS